MTRPSLEWPKCKNNATFNIKTFQFQGTKVALFSHVRSSKPLKQPKTPQILNRNRGKTTGSNDLGPMLHHLFLVKTATGLTLGESVVDDHP